MHPVYIAFDLSTGAEWCTVCRSTDSSVPVLAVPARRDGHIRLCSSDGCYRDGFGWRLLLPEEAGEDCVGNGKANSLGCDILSADERAFPPKSVLLTENCNHTIPCVL